MKMLFSTFQPVINFPDTNKNLRFPVEIERNKYHAEHFFKTSLNFLAEYVIAIGQTIEFLHSMHLECVLFIDTNFLDLQC